MRVSDKEKALRVRQHPVAPLIAESGARRVLYLGDLDLSGGHIEENTRKVLSEYGDLSWEKVTITEIQRQERNFPGVYKKDKRFKPAREFRRRNRSPRTSTNKEHLIYSAG